MSLGLTDTHAHLDHFGAEWADVVTRAKEAGVGRIITVGTDLKSSRRSVGLASSDPSVFAVVGVHPHDSAGSDDATWDELAELARQPRVVGIGETGLDYFKMYAPKEAQLAAFEKQIDLAMALDTPLVIHCRDAYEDLKGILAAKRPPRLVLHCFSAGPDEARYFLDLGCYISFSGTVTYNKAEPVREAAKIVPLDKILVETDCPYLAPQPQRGRKNEPAFIKYTAGEIAKIKGLPIEKIVEETSINADIVFDMTKIRVD